MKRWIAVLLLIVVGALAYVQFAAKESTITVTDARASSVGASGQMFMVSLNMQNDGPAVALVGVSSPSGANVSIMNPDHTGPLVVPENSKGILAMDGAHIALSVPAGTFEEGAFQSISLMFADGTTHATRVMRHSVDDGMGAMQHSPANAVEVDPSPTLDLIAPETLKAEGFDITLTVENFEFVMADDDATHIPNQGHAHVYLNGLKLGRLYDDTFSVGGLSTGSYTLHIGLNTNDHRPYASNGEPIVARFDFTIP